MCKGSGQPVISQDISNVFLACAELRLNVNQVQIQKMTQHLLQMHSNQPNQEFCNVVWSLAVMGVLDMTTFDSFLLQLASKHQLCLQSKATTVLVHYK